MNWNLQGMRISGVYMGLFPVSGKVDISRVKYGGEVSHHVALDKPIQVFGAIRDRVILEHKYVDQVMEFAE